jgi:hypothetical protein
LRTVVWAIWLMAAATFSMATTDLTALTTRKYATAETPTLTLSLVMMPLRLDGHGDDPQANPVQHVDEGDDHRQSGLPDPDDPAEREQNSLLVLLDDVQRERGQAMIDRAMTAINTYTWGNPDFGRSRIAVLENNLRKERTRSLRRRRTSTCPQRPTAGHRGPGRHLNPTPVRAGRRPVTRSAPIAAVIVRRRRRPREIRVG